MVEIEGLDHAARHACRGVARVARSASSTLQPLGRTRPRPVIDLFGAGTLEDVQLERGEGDDVEGEGVRAVGPLEVKVGPRPVHDGHEIVAQAVDAAHTKVGDRLAVVLDQLCSLGLDALLDRLMHWDALDYQP